MRRVLSLAAAIVTCGVMVAPSPAWGADGDLGKKVDAAQKKANARGGPTHLHFEIHPGGGGATNPYPTLAKYC